MQLTHVHFLIISVSADYVMNFVTYWKGATNCSDPTKIDVFSVTTPDGSNGPPNIVECSCSNGICYESSMKPQYSLRSYFTSTFGSYGANYFMSGTF